MLLLWDVDGTLIHGKGAGRRAMNRAFEQRFRVADAYRDAEFAGGLDAPVFEDAFARHGVDRADMGPFLEDYFRFLEEELVRAGASVIPGVRETLDRLTRRPDLYHALGTGNLERGARIKLGLFDLNGYFPVGGFSDGVRERAEMLERGIARAAAHYGKNFLAQDVLVIGDTVRDIAAAREVGARVLAVSTGAGDLGELRTAGPDWLVDDLREMPEIS